MLRLILFLRKIFVPLLFVALEAVALGFYAHSTPYAQARLLGASNAVLGQLYRGTNAISSYFSLTEENRLLADEVARLRNLLAAADTLDRPIDSLPTAVAPYRYTTARVVRGTVTSRQNLLILDKGHRDGIKPDMAVLSTEGAAVGYVLAVSERFAVAMSLLNTDFRLGGRIAGKGFFGSVRWDGISPRRITLSDIPKYADLQPGDSVVTAFSDRFPPDALIGTVVDFELADNLTYYEVSVLPAAPFQRIDRVLLVEYLDAEEQQTLLQSVRTPEP